MEWAGVFRINPDNKVLIPLAETDLSAQGFRERYDLQEWITTCPEILGERLLIIDKECSSFIETNERVDLVALDLEGQVVVIELKRDDSGTNVHWQAIKYASYFSRAQQDDIIKMLASYSQKTAEEARQRIIEFTGLDDLSMLNRKQRIIIASHRFAREVTSAVLWLRDGYGVDIKCIQLTPFSDPNTNALYLQSTTIIPVPGTEDFTVNFGSPIKTETSMNSIAGRTDEITSYMSSTIDTTRDLLPKDLQPDHRSRWAGTWGNLRYYHVWYNHDPWRNHSCSYKTYILYQNGKINAYSVQLNLNLKDVLEHGLTNDDIATIRSAMGEYAKTHDVKVIDDHSSVLRIDHQVTVSELNDQLRDQVASILAGLISYFTPVIEKIMEEKNVTTQVDSPEEAPHDTANEQGGKRYNRSY